MFGASIRLYIEKDAPNIETILNAVLTKHELPFEIQRSRIIWIDVFFDKNKSDFNDPADLRDTLEYAIEERHGYGDVLGMGFMLDDSGFDLEVEIKTNAAEQAIEQLLKSYELTFNIREPYSS